MTHPVLCASIYLRTYIDKNAIIEACGEHQRRHAVNIAKIHISVVNPHQSKERRQLTNT